jgi:hypothetical protein
MTKKAWVESNTIRDIAAGDPVSLYHPDIAVNYDTDVPDDAQNGWALVNGIWTAPAIVDPPPAPPQTYLHIDYPSSGQISTDITLSVTVKFANGDLAPVNATYYVPIIRESDGRQEVFKEVNFANGEATVVFQVANPGIYVMRTDKIHPAPTSTIVDHPEIIILT